MVSKANFYLKEPDKLRYILGRMLIRKMLVDFGFPGTVLHELKYDLNERPYVNRTFDFNISHSEDIVIGAISGDSKLGIDVEKIEERNLNELKEIILNNRERANLYLTKDPVRYLYDIWTLKEALLKAVGIGLKGSINEILILNESVHYDGLRWSYIKLGISSDYSCHLVYNRQTTIQTKNLTISDLFE
jgi:4'-phosphopantetheinyl transferase